MSDSRRRYTIALAFLTLYLVWGSTYLAIRIGVHDLPPALFAGVRFVISGLLLALLARASGQPFPVSVREWRLITLMGILLLAGGNGLVVVGEQWVPSNQAALLVATTALWLAGFGTLGAQGQTLTRQALAGLLLGFIGVALLLLPNGAPFLLNHFGGQLSILLAALLWSVGSIYGKRQVQTTPPLMSAAMQMLAGGLFLCAAGLSLGETGAWAWNIQGMTALAYLIVFGTLGFASYIWLLHNVAPVYLGTYAYVNPAIAVLLGWWLLDETLTGIQLIGMTIILAAVITVSLSSSPEKT
ncbi:MAG: EamA family transporter [Gammaproteobacteria bacterium]|nr:EamA family transporter [Gammaproteobacteria bacterium]